MESVNQAMGLDSAVPSAAVPDHGDPLLKSSEGLDAMLREPLLIDANGGPNSGTASLSMSQSQLSRSLVGGPGGPVVTRATVLTNTSALTAARLTLAG